MSTTTLTSLAILKVNVDLGGDYLNYLSPFVLHVLDNDAPEIITDASIRARIAEDFGLDIPERTIQIVLRRIARNYPVERRGGGYRIVGELPDRGITAKQSEAERHIGAVVRGLQDFSSTTLQPIRSFDDAVLAICAFLSEFSVTCLRAYLHGTAIPKVAETHTTDVVSVSEYVQYLQAREPERFQSFLILVQGHMLANALLCPDLRSAPATYRKVTFYLDTPLLIHSLGLEGEAKKNAISELTGLLEQLGGRVAAFSHSYQELTRVLEGAANWLEDRWSQSPITIEARKCGTTKSDLLLLAESAAERLSDNGISIRSTPPYSEAHQIDEVIFGDVLQDEVTYFNPRARVDDINSVRSIYALRGNARVRTLESARAILVTSNTAFAKAAWNYGKEYESSEEVSSVISDFSLANLAWLKAPMGSPEIPLTQLLAFSYAALQPSPKLLSKYMSEIDRLEDRGDFTTRDLQLLRSSTQAYESIVHITLGDSDLVNEGTLSSTLERVTDEIRREEAAKLADEERAHIATQEALEQEELRRIVAEDRSEVVEGQAREAAARNEQVLKKLYWHCDRNSRRLATGVIALAALFLIAGVGSGLGLRPTVPIVGWVLAGGSVVLIVVSAANLVLGSNLRTGFRHTRKWLLMICLRRSASATGIRLDDLLRGGEHRD